MPTLVAVGPVTIHNVNKGGSKEVPLISFDKKSTLVVDMDGTAVTMTYSVTENLYRATGPQNNLWEATGPKFQAQ